jgi:hypothetical protein
MTEEGKPHFIDIIQWFVLDSGYIRDNEGADDRMSLELEFNPEAARNAPKHFNDKSPAEITDWFTAIAREATAQPRALDALEDAFLKQLKSLSAYADLYTAAAVKLEKGQDTQDGVTRSLKVFMPGITGGIDAMLRRAVAVSSGIAKLKGPQVHPAVKYLAGEAGKLTEDDYTALAKPLRVLATALAKSSAAAPPPPKRKFVGS